MSTENVTNNNFKLLVTVKVAAAAISIEPGTLRDWISEEICPFPTVKLKGKRLVPYKLLQEYVDGLISAELSKPKTKTL